MAPQNSVVAKATSAEARRWHFGIATCSDYGRLLMSLKNSNCKSLSHLSWLVGQGPDCYYMYQDFVVWQGERCFNALKNKLLDAAFGRGPEPNQVPEIEEISVDQAVNAALNFPKRKRGAYTSLAKLGLPESIRNAPGVEGYATTHCPNWTPKTPMYREYLSDGFREPADYERPDYPGSCFSTLPSRKNEGYRYRYEGDVLTFAVYFTPGLILAIAAQNMEVA